MTACEGALGYLVARRAQRLSHFEHGQRGELITPCIKLVGYPGYKRRALLERDAAPRGGRNMRRAEPGVDAGVIQFGECGKSIAGRGVSGVLSHVRLTLQCSIPESNWSVWR